MSICSWRTWVLISVFSFIAGACQANVVVDDFNDGGVVVHAPPTAGYDTPSAGLGGYRALYFSNNTGDMGTLTLDPSAGSLSINSTGVGQVTVGYGYRLYTNGYSLVGTSETALNADFTRYTGFRFQILTNDAVNGSMRMRLSVNMSTGGAGATATGGAPMLVDSPTGTFYDLPFSAFTTYGGGAHLNDIDYLSFTFYSGYVGNSISVGDIELVSAVPESTSLALMAGVGIVCAGWRWFRGSFA